MNKAHLPLSARTIHAALLLFTQCLQVVLVQKYHDP